MNTIQTGSRVFFNDIKDFTPKDNDSIVIVDNPIGFKYTRQTSITGKCLFEVANLDKNTWIEYALSKNVGMLLGRFLTPEYAKFINLTIDDLKRLQPLIDKLDDKHKYQEVIYNAYLENGKFELTDNQRDKAYEVYKEARKNDL